MKKLAPFFVVLFSIVSGMSLFAVDPSQTVTISDQTGGSAKAYSFSAQQLKDLVKQGSLSETTVRPVIVYGEMSGDFGIWSFTGISLRDFVKYATGYKESMDNQLYKLRKQLFLACYAGDGYSGVISWPELVLSSAGSSAIVAYSWEMLKGPKAGGEPKWTGDLILLMPSDVFTGSREIQALKSIELRSIGNSALAK
jgi:hypothetical protein